METSPNHRELERASSTSAARARAWNWQEAIVLLALLVFFLLVRLRTLESIELGGDAIQKWFFVKGWAHERPFEGVSWNHHLTRMGDNLPVYFVQRLLGTSPPVYYAAPTLAFLVTAFCTYVIGKRVDSRFTGVLAAIGVTVFSSMRRAASQILPSIFSSMYIMLATYCLLRYTRSEGRARTAWLLASALCVFAGYASHETSLYFGPAIVVVQWLHGRRWRDSLMFCGALLGLFLLECAFYAAVTDYPSRLHIMMANHGARTGMPVDKGVVGLFARFSSPDFNRDFQRLFAFWPVAALGVAVLRRDRFARWLALLPASFLFLVTFVVHDISPVRAWLSFQSRYLIPPVPLMMLTCALFFVTLARALWSGFVRLRERLVPGLGATSALGALRARVRIPTLAALGRFVRSDVLWILLLLGWRANVYVPVGGIGSLLRSNALVTARRTGEVLTDAYVRNLPIIGPRRAIRLVFEVYIDDAALLENGRFVSRADKARRFDRRRQVLLGQPDAYIADAKNKNAGRAGGRSCVMYVSVKQRFMRPVKALPARCVAVEQPAS